MSPAVCFYMQHGPCQPHRIFTSHKKQHNFSTGMIFWSFMNFHSTSLSLLSPLLWCNITAGTSRRLVCHSHSISPIFHSVIFSKKFYFDLKWCNGQGFFTPGIVDGLLRLVKNNSVLNEEKGSARWIFINCQVPLAIVHLNMIMKVIYIAFTATHPSEIKFRRGLAEKQNLHLSFILYCL